MVIAFLSILLIIEFVGIILFLASLKDIASDVGLCIIGWFVGASTCATGYVLFYQIFPHACPVVMLGGG